MSKQATKSMSSKINALLNISDSYQAPARVMEILNDPNLHDKVFFDFMEAFDYDNSYEWFYQYFEDEHADRRNNKQDFTPTSISLLTSAMLNSSSEEGIVYEPACGTGSMIIQDWYLRTRKTTPWNYNPMSVLYICEELSDKTVPFLLFNIMIRGINAVVIHGNTLTRECKEVYHCFNESNDAMTFSSLYKLPHTEKTEKMFNVKFI